MKIDELLTNAEYTSALAVLPISQGKVLLEVDQDGPFGIVRRLSEIEFPENADRTFIKASQALAKMIGVEGVEKVECVGTIRILCPQGNLFCQVHVQEGTFTPKSKGTFAEFEMANLPELAQSDELWISKAEKRQPFDLVLLFNESLELLEYKFFK